MNHEPNTKHWAIGDLVIHDADAKQAYMLMQVVGFTREGLVKTQYVHQIRSRVWENELKYLHDPKRFNITI